MVSNESGSPLKNVSDSNTLYRYPSDSFGEIPISEGKRMMAAKIAGSVGSGGAPIKVINAFLQVKDYTGLDRYLSKHKIPSDILTSALQKSCMISDVESVEILAKHGANVNYVDQFGTTLLHFAMRGGGNESIIVSLITHGLEYSSWRSDGMPLLHWACSRGQIRLVEKIVESKRVAIQEPDQNGRLAIHVAAVYGQPEVLSYLIQALSSRICFRNVPTQFREDLEDLGLDDTSMKISVQPEISVTSRPAKSSLRRMEGQLRRDRTQVESSGTPQTIAAANYLDQHNWTPLHHASCEEAVNLYQECLKILLDHGADPMLPTPQGKTALDLAYGAGRSQVLVDVLPKRLLIALLMRIDDIVPPHVRSKQKHVKEAFSQLRTPSRDRASKTLHSLVAASRSPSQTDFELRTRKGYSFLRRLADNMEGEAEDAFGGRPLTDKSATTDAVNIMSVWRKILLNDSVELLETLRDSLVWREKKQDSNLLQFDSEAVGDTADFDAAQKLSLKQMSELFSDCYENGTGVYSYVQTKYQQALKMSNFRSVLRSMTGLHTFNTLSTNRLAIHRPLYKSLLFLALICGRFRVTEQLLRMRQFDILPAAVLVALILRRLRKEPSFPQQVISELERFTERVEQIAVDVLNLASLKDNTPEKMICRDLLSVPLRTYGNFSMIDLFAKAKCNELLSLPCCQRLLDERWHGVLTNFPNWMRWASKVFPMSGIIYIECKARIRNTRTDRNRQKGGQSLRLISKQAFGDPDGVAQQPWAAVFIGKEKYVSKNEETNDDKSWRRMPQDELSTDSTINAYENFVGRDLAKTTPRWHFIMGVYRSPAMRFCVHSLSHLLFLICFSFVCIFSLKINLTLAEVLSIAYVVAYAAEELKQITTEVLRDGLKDYIKDGWNWIDVLAIGITSIGFCIRMVIEEEAEWTNEDVPYAMLYVTRNLYMIGLNLFYMRTLYITSISQIIGPRLKMMADMLRKDLVPLLIVFAIFICSYGVWFQGLLYPNSFSKTRETKVHRLQWHEVLKQMFRRAFYSIFEVSIVLDEDVKQTGGDEQGLNIVIYFVLVLYTGIVNIILINLLIALFSNTVSRIDQSATALWLASRYRMVKEYSERTILPPPLNVVCIAYEIVQYVFYQCKYCTQRSKHRVSKRRQPMRVGQESESDSCDSDEVIEKRINREFKWLRQARRWNRAMRVSHAKHNHGTSEQDVVLKFILLQSFALQDRRQLLGSGLGSQVFALNQTSGPMYDESSTRNETPVVVTRIQQRMESLEKKIDRIVDQLDAIGPTSSSVPDPDKRSPKRMPIPLRMPKTRLGMNASQDSIQATTHIPTSSEIMAKLSKQNSWSSRSDTVESRTSQSFSPKTGTLSLSSTPGRKRKDFLG